jgi:hypothetical protein
MVINAADTGTGRGDHIPDRGHGVATLAEYLNRGVENALLRRVCSRPSPLAWT